MDRNNEYVQLAESVGLHFETDVEGVWYRANTYMRHGAFASITEAAQEACRVWGLGDVAD